MVTQSITVVPSAMRAADHIRISPGKSSRLCPIRQPSNAGKGRRSYDDQCKGPVRAPKRPSLVAPRLAQSLCKDTHVSWCSRPAAIL